MLRWLYGKPERRTNERERYVQEIGDATAEMLESVPQEYRGQFLVSYSKALISAMEAARQQTHLTDNLDILEMRMNGIIYRRS